MILRRNTKLSMVLVATLLLAAIFALIFTGKKQAAKADALWKIVHGKPGM